LIARIVSEPQTMAAAAFGILPVAVGVGYFVDATLIHRDIKAT
jgi:hypothetical protein